MSTVYQSPKSLQHAEGRADQRRQVADILANMTPFSRRPTRPHIRTVWNEALGRYVELR